MVSAYVQQRRGAVVRLGMFNEKFHLLAALMGIAVLDRGDFTPQA